MPALRKPLALAFSLLTHGGILAWVASGPVHEKQDSEYQQLIAPQASKLVWYDFREKLPDVSPRKASLAPTPPRVDVKLNSQEMVAGSLTAPRAQQFIWQPVPKIQLKQDLRSPNLLAFSAPHAEPPPKPKLFVPPPEAPKPAAETPALTPAPQIQTAAVLGHAPLAPALARPKPLPFSPPVEAKKGPIPEPKLEAPPEVAARPDLSASARPAVGAELAKPMRPAFVPPPAGHGGKPSPFGPALPAAPDLPTGASGANLTVAIVGLNPSTAPPAPLPDGGRDAQFAAGPHLRAVGGAGGTTDSNALVVPGLLVHGAPATPANGSPVLVARAAAPTSLRNLTAAVRSSLPGTGATGATADNAPAAGVRVTSAPDPILDGRIVYAMTVQMPNVTSYAGSWMIWFAERERALGGSGTVSAPVPLRKVDPKYVASAISERIEGKVRLAAIIRADGHVDSVQVLHPLDERLDRSAEEAIAKWQFEPARRSGQPVDVDAVIEIPFLLAPQIPH